MMKLSKLIQGKKSADSNSSNVYFESSEGMSFFIMVCVMYGIKDKYRCILILTGNKQRVCIKHWIFGSDGQTDFSHIKVHYHLLHVAVPSTNW